MIEDSDTPDVGECQDYLLSYAKWRVAQVDSTRSSEIYFQDAQMRQKNFLESYIDRTPEDGGTELQLDSGIVDRSLNIAEEY